jgi:hypothetical protein
MGVKHRPYTARHGFAAYLCLPIAHPCTGTDVHATLVWYGGDEGRMGARTVPPRARAVLYRRRLLVFLSALLSATTLWVCGLLLATEAVSRAYGRDRFNLVQWELTRLPRKYLHTAAVLVRRDHPSDARTATLVYFAAVRAVQEAETAATAGRSAPSPVDLEALRARVRELKPGAEAAVERELDRAVRQAGLTRRPWLGRRLTLVWPPVDAAFDDAPFVLAVSRRDRVVLLRTTVLRSGLTPNDVARIERATEQDGVSAIVEPLGGFAAYPSVVRVDAGPAAAVGTAAHEWVHHYLAFFPLGAAYGASPALTTINETVADIAGRELAARVRERLALPSEPPRPAPAIDAAAAIRDLRREVDALLAAGNIAGAEHRMEETRRYLSDRGVTIGRINQAYLAFHNLYADAPGATDPIGPRLRRLRALSPDLAAFMRAVRDIRQVNDLTEAIEHAELREAGNGHTLPKP